MKPQSDRPLAAHPAPSPSPAGSALPLRVQAQLAAYRRHTQVLTGWVQLGIVGLFAALYAVAPKTFSSNAPFEPVALVLGAYALFTLFRLALAYRRELPPWVLVLSAILDMALLMAAIWSFHLQYRQPAAFYLKAPTLLYVFIFIALRALSYRPAYVLASGGTAALGCSAPSVRREPTLQMPSAQRRSCCPPPTPGYESAPRPSCRRSLSASASTAVPSCAGRSATSDGSSSPSSATPSTALPSCSSTPRSRAHPHWRAPTPIASPSSRAMPTQVLSRAAARGDLSRASARKSRSSTWLHRFTRAAVSAGSS